LSVLAVGFIIPSVHHPKIGGTLIGNVPKSGQLARLAKLISAELIPAEFHRRFFDDLLSAPTMMFTLNQALAIATIAPLTVGTALLHRFFTPDPPAAIADTLSTPPPGVNHQTLIARAAKAAHEGEYDSAIINYRRAKRTARTGCDLGLAVAGEIASLEAKEWNSTLRVVAPTDAAETADMAYNRRFRQARKSIIDGMFCTIGRTN
jgi:hypothetical protein